MMLTKYNEWCIIYTSFVVFCVLMKINKNVYRKILANTPVSPIEIGGIIGMKSEIVTDCFLDYSGSNYGKYCPDIELINKKINQWIEEGVTFCGIFHSHYPSGEQLSSDDTEYINHIVLNLKDCCDFLYFPIIIPDKRIVAYKAKIVDGEVVILPDEIEIID